MNSEIHRDHWTEYFKEFSKRNQFRSTKLEILGDLGIQREEQHLPLAGISVDESGQASPQIHIMLGSDGAGSARHLTHSIPHVVRVLYKRVDDRDEAIEFVDAANVKTILQFEILPALSPVS